MSEEYFFLEYHLKTLKFLVRYGGMCLESRRRSLKDKIKDRIIYILNFLWLNFDVSGSIVWFGDGLMNGKSIVVLSRIAPCVVFSFVADVKGYFFIRHEDEVNELIDGLKKLEKVNVMKKHEKIILKEETKFLAIVIKMLNVINVILLTTFALSPLILIVYIYLKTKELDLTLPFLVLYPFDSKDLRIWPFVYFHQIWSECVVVLNACVFDYFFYICCMFIKIQFRLLQHRLENIVIEDSEETPLPLTYGNLVKFVNWHQELIRLCSVLETVYTEATVCNFLCSSMMICLTGFSVMTSPTKPMRAPRVKLSAAYDYGPQIDPKLVGLIRILLSTTEDLAFRITFLVFLSSNLMQIFLLCLFGDMLMRSSMEFGDAVYKSKWYQSNPAISKNLLFMLRRTQKPCKLTAMGFADVNLPAFTKILSSAWSYFALLKTMYSSART